jgi:hypothetical protein
MSKGTAFTRSRSYTYGSSSRPHAVTEVDNTDGSHHAAGAGRGVDLDSINWTIIYP